MSPNLNYCYRLAELRPSRIKVPTRKCKDPQGFLKMHPRSRFIGSFPVWQSGAPPASVMTARMVHRIVLRCVSPINERQHRRWAGDADEVDAVAVAVFVGKVVPGWSKAVAP